MTNLYKKCNFTRVFPINSTPSLILLLIILVTPRTAGSIVQLELSERLNSTSSPVKCFSSDPTKGSQTICKISSGSETDPNSEKSPPVISILVYNKLCLLKPTMNGTCFRNVELRLAGFSGVEVEVEDTIARVHCTANYMIRMWSNGISQGTPTAREPSGTDDVSMQVVDPYTFNESAGGLIYTSWLNLWKPSAGLFTCSSAEDPWIKTAVYVFTNNSGGGDPFVPVQDSTVMKILDPLWSSEIVVVVPCRTNRWDVKPTLTIKAEIGQVDREDSCSGTDKLEADVRWDPKVGFILPRNSTCTFGFYICEHGGFKREFLPLEWRKPSLDVTEDGMRCDFEMDLTVHRWSEERRWNQTLVRCSTAMSCNYDSSFGSLIQNWVETVDVAVDRHDYNRRHRPVFRQGIFACRDGPSSHPLIQSLTMTKYFTGLDGSLYYVPSRTPYPKAALIQLDEFRPIFWVNGSLEHEFTCRTALFVMLPQTLIAIKYSNGSSWHFVAKDLAAVGRPTAEKDENLGVYVYSLRVPLDSSVVEVMCMAPSFELRRWERVRKAVQVRDAFPPLLVETTRLKVFKKGTLNEAVTCPFTGEPSPTVRWNFSDQINSENIQGRDSPTLTFTVVSEEVVGTYTCTASNQYGTNSFEYEVQLEEEEGVGTAVTIGVTIGVSVALFGTAICLGLKYRRARKIIAKLTPQEIEAFYKGDPEATNAVAEGPDKASVLPFRQTIPREHLTILRDTVLGQGHFGVVYRGFLNSHPVAVKTLKRSVTHEEVLGSLLEIKIMAYIGEHRNIVKFFGAELSQLENHIVFIVMELSPFGSLDMYLKLQKRSGVNYLRLDGKSDNYCHLGTETATLLYFCEQIAAGMEYLEHKSVVHGDLAARNILVFHDRVVKVTDFGFSKQLTSVGTHYVARKRIALPWRWAAMELLQRSEFSSKSDVWSFGVTAWEVFTGGDLPYADISDARALLRALGEGKRLDSPALSTEPVFQLMQSCWNVKPSDRPSFGAIRNFFRDQAGQEVICKG